MTYGTISNVLQLGFHSRRFSKYFPKSGKLINLALKFSRQGLRGARQPSQKSPNNLQNQGIHCENKRILKKHFIAFRKLNKLYEPESNFNFTLSLNSFLMQGRMRFMSSVFRSVSHKASMTDATNFTFISEITGYKRIKKIKSQ
jgi:hypothetical protein